MAAKRKSAPGAAKSSSSKKQNVARGEASTTTTATATRPLRTSARSSGAGKEEERSPATNGVDGGDAKASPVKGGSTKRKGAQASADVPVVHDEENEAGTETGKDKGKGQKRYWLMKAEPDLRVENGVKVSYSIDDLRDAKAPEQWDGVRNFRARNNMQAMEKGDLAFFYHSNCKEPGIAGIMEVVEEASVDESAFDPQNRYYDAKSTRENPRWFAVKVAFSSKFDVPVSLTEMKQLAGPGQPLEKMQVVKISRLSVTEVTEEEWAFIMGHVQAKEHAAQSA
ncbi:MAG: hypothetical protein M1838_000868 [Thelocarpon superellum]|nr:MAG: hypothetical protein M1838_000868 [Thelocarpon superellum]